MSKYSIEKNNSIRGIKVFYDLIIDGQNLFENFRAEIKSRNQQKLNSELTRVYSRFNLYANNLRFDDTQIKRLDKIKKYALWEIKTKNLRVYFIHHSELNHIICFGGTKKTQKKDINKFKAMVNEFSVIGFDFK